MSVWSRTRVCAKLDVLADELDLETGIRHELFQTQLDTLNLLRDSRQDPLLQSIELVKTSPSANLTQAHKDTTHRLEIKGFIAAEHQHEAAELDA